MTNSDAGHYRQAGLTERIVRELTDAGYRLEDLQPDDLAGVDEFHLGGRVATDEILAGLDLTTESRVLDVGCGIGGAARTVAAAAGCSVTGVDLTTEFVTTAQELSAAVGMGHLTTFAPGNALNLPFDDHCFDAVLMLHVGMNIEDKDALMAELCRVVAPGGTVVVYDIMHVGDGEVQYPMPWASDPSMSFLARPDHYRRSMSAAGLHAADPADRLALVRDAMSAAQQHPPPVNLSHLMGANWGTMFTNLRAALDGGVLAPTQITARNPIR